MASNRFIDRDNPKETSRVDLNTTLLDIMQKEFPNDPLYSQGYLTPKQITQLSTYVKPVNEREVTVAMRDSYNVLQMTSGSKTYAEYTLDKSYPTINDTDLDNFIDDGWDFYVKTNLPRPIPPTGLFLINSEIELNPVDWHDAYLQYGPTTITARLGAVPPDPESVVRSTFCVYYVENGRALPIPNYQTLEVMLVERGKTYSDIREATPEQIQEFDMVLDGTFEGDRTLGKPNPIEEFEFRKVLDRSNDWNYQVRFESGYRPKAPFYRDPGDYLKPRGYVGTGASDIYLAEDPRDLYFDQVFQKQTYREKLRVKYEGKMVILDWPVPYNDTLVNSGTTDVQGDDLIFGLRMMINGFWKQVTDEDVARTYAALNNLSLSNYQIGQGRYSENGWLNLLVEAGGIEVLKNDGINSPIWNDFPHIVEADRLDIFEYRNYIDNYSNSGEPFNIEYLKPYEPEGSIAYYPPIRLRVLQQQAAAQAEIESIKADIQESWPRLAARTLSLSSLVNSQPTDGYTVLYRNKLGSPAAQPSIDDLNTPLYKILTADEPYRYVKRQNNGNLVEQATSISLLGLFEGTVQISRNFKPYQENDIFGINRSGLVHSVATDERLGNIGYAQLPRRGDSNSNRVNSLTRNTAYVKRMVRAAIISYNKGSGNYWKDDSNKDYFDMDPLYTEAERVDKLISELRTDLQLAKDFVLEIDDLLFAADSLEAFQDIYNRMIALEDDLSAVSEQALNDCNQCRIKIEATFKTFMEKLYNSVQYFRQKVHDEIGNASKFGVEWPSSAILLMNIHLPGKTFDNYLPTNS
jgi:hypothetical protein